MGHEIFELIVVDVVTLSRTVQPTVVEHLFDVEVEVVEPSESNSKATTWAQKEAVIV